MSVGERPLREVLTLDVDPVRVEVTAGYPMAGVYSFGRGLFRKSELRGSDTSYKKLHRLRRGHLAVSKVRAFKGAVAVVPPEFDGFHLSAEFLTFSSHGDKLDEVFLSHLCAWPDLWQRLASTSTGRDGSRRKVDLGRLLEIRLPIPDIDSQREVGRTLTRHRQQVRALEASAKRAMELSEAAAVALACRHDLSDSEKKARGWARVRLGLLMEQVARPVPVDPTETYPNVGLYSYGRGVFRKEPIDGSRTSATTLNRVSAGQFIYSKKLAFEGAYAHVPTEFDGFFASGEYPTFQTHADELDARWLATYMRSKSNWTEPGTGSRDLGRRRRRLDVDSLLDFEIWKPPLAEQRQVWRRVLALTRHRKLRAQVEPVAAALWLSRLNELVATPTA